MLETKYGAGRSYFHEVPLASRRDTVDVFGDLNEGGQIKVRKLAPPKSRFLQATQAKYLATNDEAYKYRQQAMMEDTKQTAMPRLL